MSKYIRGVDVLQFVNLGQSTMYETKVPGYFFEVKTKDGENVTLFVYKYNGGWLVNDTISKSKVVGTPKPTRKEAVATAEGIFKRITLDWGISEMERLRELKKKCAIVDAPEGAIAQ